MDNIPYELQINIYKFRASYELRKICDKYYISFEKLCDFLIKNKGIIVGSCAIHCIDPSCSFSDIDICIQHEKVRFPPDYYKEFLSIYTIDNSEVKINKNPIDNSVSEKETDADYHLEFLVNEKKIDMTLMPYDPKIVMCEENIFDISNIIFDGRNWNIPFNFNDFMKFLKHKEFKIVNPYSNSIDTIYDPCQYETTNELIESANKKNLIQNLDKIINHKMKSLYSDLMKYYIKKEDELLFEKLSDMVAIYNKITNQTFIPDECIEKLLREKIERLKFCKFGGFGRGKAIEIWDSIEEDAYKSYKTDKLDIKIIEANKDNEIVESFWNDPSLILIEKENRNKMKEIYKIYRGWYYILKYIFKGYICVNIKDYYGIF